MATDYKPMFHYLAVRREGDGLVLTSYCLKRDFSGFSVGYEFSIGAEVPTETAE